MSEENRNNRRRRIQEVRDQAEALGIGMGKLPPQACEIEEAVLGAAMLEREGLQIVISKLKPDHFYKTAHNTIFRAIINLSKKGSPIDILTVTHELRAMGELETVGGPLYISQLTNRVASTANTETHCLIIIEKFLARELIRIGNEIIRDGYDDSMDVFNIIGLAQRHLDGLTEDSVKGDPVLMGAITDETTRMIESRSKSDDASTIHGIPSSIRDLNRMLGRYQRKNFIVVAARPGMGKTAMMLSEAIYQATLGIPVVFFTLEMSEEELTFRALSIISGVDSTILSKQKIEDSDKLNAYFMAVDVLKRLPIYIDGTSSLSVYDLRAKVRKLKKRNGIQVVYVDYIQLMTVGEAASEKLAKSGNREQEISTISRNLKGIAKELEIPLIAGSQLNRGVETRGGDKRPKLADLRESGAIEQDTDVVITLYRPEYYNEKEDAHGNSSAGVAEVTVLKQRNGALGVVFAQFIATLTKYTNRDDAGNGITSWKPSHKQVEHTDKRSEALAPNERFLNKNEDDDLPF